MANEPPRPDSHARRIHPNSPPSEQRGKAQSLAIPPKAYLSHPSSPSTSRAPRSPTFSHHSHSNSVSHSRHHNKSRLNTGTLIVPFNPAQKPPSFTTPNDADQNTMPYDNDLYDDDNLDENDDSIVSAITHMSLTSPFLALFLALYTLFLAITYGLAALSCTILGKEPPRRKFRDLALQTLNIQLRCVGHSHIRTESSTQPPISDTQRGRPLHRKDERPNTLSPPLSTTLSTSLLAPFIALTLLFIAWLSLIPPLYAFILDETRKDAPAPSEEARLEIEKERERERERRESENTNANVDLEKQGRCWSRSDGWDCARRVRAWWVRWLRRR